MSAWLPTAGQTAEVPAWNAPPADQTGGRFWRWHPFDRSLMPGENGRTRRLRINSPEASLHPSFGKRPEARENGLMLIRAEEDLFQVRAAELCLELWGGHPGTANKRVSINGRSTYPLPEVGTAAGHCNYSHPAVSLRITDLVNGWNACPQGGSPWMGRERQPEKERRRRIQAYGVP